MDDLADISTIDREKPKMVATRPGRMMIQADAKILDDRLNDESKFPLGYKSEMAAGMDLYACIDSPLVLEPGQCELIGTGVAIHLGSPDFVGLLMPRSGLGHKHGIVLGNLTGVIDADYQGELKVSLWNRSQKPYVVDPMERIAQYIALPQFGLSLNFVEEFGGESGRGAGGFGSTGGKA